MCRLLAISSRRAPSQALFDKFKALSFEGQTPTLGPDGIGHNDGWGLAGYLGQRLIYEKSALSVTDSQSGWDEAIKRLLAPSLWPGHFMLHLRRASPGLTVRLSNSHPYHRKFNGADWFFMHNGTVEGFDPTEMDEMTDSEYFMELVLGQMKGGSSLKEALPAAKAELLARFTSCNSFVGCFLNPKGIEAFYDVPDQFDRYHTLYRAEAEGSVIVCSEAMEVDGLTWTPYREMGGVLSVPSFRRG